MDETGEQAGEFVLLGKITKPHGIRGELKVYPFTEHSESLRRYKELFLSSDDGQTLERFTRTNVRVQGRQVILRLKECCDRNRAEELVGHGVWVKSEELPELDEGEYYLFELEGKVAETDTGERLGIITAVLVGAGQDLLNIRNDEREFLVPLVPEFFVRRENDTVVLRLPSGLLEIND